MCKRAVVAFSLLIAVSNVFAEPTAERRAVFQPSANSPRFTIVEKHGETPTMREVSIFAADGTKVVLRQEVYADNASSVVKVLDLSGDGLLDLLLWDASSGARNDIYSAYLFDDVKNIFVKAQVRKPNNVDSDFVTQPSWDAKAKALHERRHMGSAGAEFIEYCSRWEGSVLSAYLMIDSTGLKKKNQDDEPGFRLTLTRIGNEGNETKRFVVDHEKLVKRYLMGAKDRNTPCAMWERTFNALRK